jgi:NADH dehydrogenase [ubiquinone] 1 alpha subcomplex assembly factor 5
MQPPEIFSITARQLARDRMLASPVEDRWLIERMGVEVLERLGAVRRTFETALLIGDANGTVARALRQSGVNVTLADPGARLARSMGGVQIEEDRLSFASASFDLVIALGTLDTVNDLPGALILIRRALKADGLFLAAIFGAGCLPQLRQRLIASESATVARLHPAIDIRAAGDLLSRAGFTMQVAESEAVPVRYRDIRRLFADLRANGASNVLASRTPMTRESYVKLLHLAVGGGFEDVFNLLFLTGWSSGPRSGE